MGLAMQAPRDIQSQLRSLTIGEGQRPTKERSAGSRSLKPVLLVIFLAIVAVAAGGYVWPGVMIQSGQGHLGGGPATDAPQVIVTRLTPPPPTVVPGKSGNIPTARSMRAFSLTTSQDLTRSTQADPMNDERRVGMPGYLTATFFGGETLHTATDRENTPICFYDGRHLHIFQVV